MRPAAWTAAALSLLWSWKALGDDVPSRAASEDSPSRFAAIDTSDYVVYKVHQVEVVLAEDGRPPGPPDTARHLDEKKRLMQRLHKKHGIWNEHHPRHRLLEALRGFSAYAETQQAELNRLKGLYSHVSRKQKARLEKAVKYSQKFADIERLLQQDQRLCDDIVKTAMDFYGVDAQELAQHTQSMKTAGRPAEKVSVSQALKHYVRDWAASGANERNAAFPCILTTLRSLFPNPGPDGVRVLLPGAGLGRLGHEIAKLPGFQVTNNEWSAYQNVAYRFLEQHPHPGRANSSTAHPFVDSWSHHRTTADMLRAVSFPDDPPDPRGVVLVEGDFTTVFSDSGSTGAYDVVVTHFFIDTARNMMSYLDTIARVLRPGGHWVNFGPLLYGSGPFVQLALDEVVAVSEGMGFAFLDVAAGECGGGKETIPGKRVYGVEAVYGFNELSLTRNAYEAQFWVARKD